MMVMKIVDLFVMLGHFQVGNYTKTKQCTVGVNSSFFGILTH